jgi:hypothetical protein
LMNMLLNESMAPTLIAARVRQTIDHWNANASVNGYGPVDISHRPDILGTLYSIGLTGDAGVHGDPQSNSRGRDIVNSMPRMRELLTAQSWAQTPTPTPGIVTPTPSPAPVGPTQTPTPTVDPAPFFPPTPGPTATPTPGRS